MAFGGLGAIENEVCTPVLKETNKLVPLSCDPCALCGRLAVGDQFSGSAHTDTKGQWQRSGTQAILLPTAIDERFNTVVKVATNIEGADPLRTVHFVCGKANPTYSRDDAFIA